jgi:anaerobic selenocysteine-containing dehydrogenase
MVVINHIGTQAPETNTGDGWKTTGCVLCAQNCGLEVLIENGRLIRSRPDKSNPRSEGYICRKGSNIAHFQHHAQRLTRPLKQVNGTFEPISWDRAIDEIADKLQNTITEHGPRSLAFVGGGGQGSHFSAAFAVRLLRALGSNYHYSALAQELTGKFWVMGRCLGRQYVHTEPDVARTEMLVALGWNPWMSHQIPQARRHVTRIQKDPDKLLVVIDPRRTATAERADIHLAIRPGTDALLLKAVLATILSGGWYDEAYVAAHVTGFDQIRSWFEDFDVSAALRACELDSGAVHELCRMMATRKWSMHSDLGVLMNRHSTMASYLELILLAVCGRIGVPGGNVIPGHVMPLGSHSDERDARTWRTLASDYPAIMGVFPPNVLPEEISSGHPERVRAVLISDSNPLRSYADTTAYEDAFSRLDLLVTTELAMTETAAVSDYVLPARSPYEAWDGTFFSWTYPEVYFQMRRPVVEPEGEALETSEVYVRLADRLGLVPAIPESLVEAAHGDRLLFGTKLLEYAAQEPRAQAMMPFVLARTLGVALGSASLAALWGLLSGAPKSFRTNAVRAGFQPLPTQGDELFQSILDHPEGIWVGRCSEEDNLSSLRTEDGRVNVMIEELADTVIGLDASSEAAALASNPEYPLVLVAGFRNDLNANTLMRNPEWNEGRRGCTVQIHPKDADSLGIIDGAVVVVSTEAGEVEVEAEVTAVAHRGQVAIPHGFGLDYGGGTDGVNVNRLTPGRHRDPIAGTPLHKHVPCRVTPVAES